MVADLLEMPAFVRKKVLASRAQEKKEREDVAQKAAQQAAPQASPPSPLREQDGKVLPPAESA